MHIEQRGLAVGFEFKPLVERHVYNSFDCHRLLHLAQSLGLQTPLKSALFDAYFKRGDDISDRKILSQIALDVGLDSEQIKYALENEQLRLQLSRLMEDIKQAGINSVPALIINQKYLVNGARTPQEYTEIITQALND